MTNKLTINYNNPALIQSLKSKVLVCFYLKSVVVRLLRTVKGISVGYPWPNYRGLRTNSKLIPEGHFMQVERGRVRQP